jgi:hypothetical protein
MRSLRPWQDVTRERYRQLIRELLRAYGRINECFQKVSIGPHGISWGPKGLHGVSWGHLTGIDDVPAIAA